MNEQYRRVLMAVCGVSVGAVGAGYLSYCDLGMDPFQVLAHGLWGLTPLDYGTFYVILNALMLVGVFFWNRKKIGIGTVINLFGVGYIMSFTEGILGRLMPQPALPGRVMLLTCGLVIMCFASAMYFTADLGVSTYDAVALTLSERTDRVPFKFIRIATDLICVAVGWALGVGKGVGVGTVITAFFMGPLISFFNRTVAEPLRYGESR